MPAKASMVVTAMGVNLGELDATCGDLSDTVHYNFMIEG